MSAFNNTANKNYSTAPNPPQDTVSHLSFGPNMQNSVYLAAASWDGSISCYEVNANKNIIFKAKKLNIQPIFDTCWSIDGNQVYIACGDNCANMWDLQSDQLVKVAQHDKPVRTVHFIDAPSYKCLMTMSWDCTVKFWDLRSQNPMKVLTSDSKFCATDVVYPMALFLRADNKVQLCALDGEPRFDRLDTINDAKFTCRTIAGFLNANKTPEGYTVGGCDGRVHVTYLNTTSDNYIFKCHRQNVAARSTPAQNVHMVNAMAFHPVHRTLLTAGGDGFYYGWNIRNRAKVCTSRDFASPLTACCFSADGNVTAVASGYDWAKGYSFNLPTNNKPEIHVKATGNDMAVSSSGYSWR